MNRIRIFIGSSGEGLHLAQAIQQNLESDFDCEIWNQDIFKLGDGVLETLCESLHVYDFAILALTPDDLTQSRENLIRKNLPPRTENALKLNLKGISTKSLTSKESKIFTLFHSQKSF